MNLNVKNDKPVVFVKVQTTGLKPATDKILELALIKFEDGKEPVTVTRRFNPGINIPEEASAYNGITNEDVKNEPAFEEKAEGILSFIKGCDFIGFNVRGFDIPFLSAELYRSGVEFTTFGTKFVDLKNFYQRIDARNFQNAVKTFLGKDIESNISSGDYLSESVELFNAMLDKSNGQKLGTGEVVESSFPTLSKLFDPSFGSLDIDGKIVLNEDKRPVFNFGKKHRGKVVADVLLTEDPGYFQFILDGDFSRDTKTVVKKIVQKAKAQAEKAV